MQISEGGGMYYDNCGEIVTIFNKILYQKSELPIKYLRKYYKYKQFLFMLLIIITFE